ncbi:integrase arm-type DNA-binding domain-containing protein [Achromobacter aloeverae]
MPENLFTDAKVRSAKSTDRDWKLSDGGGLFLLVKPTGGKLWRWKYRLQGKENLFAIGGFPQVSLAEARAAREKARALVKQGIYPAHERQQVKQRNLEALEERKRARESSFAKVAKAYLAEIKPVFAQSSYRTKESRIRKYLSPKFDGMPMSDIGEELGGCCRTNGRGGLFLFCIGPLSLECRSIAICLCPRLGAGNGVNNGVSGAIVT